MIFIWYIWYEIQVMWWLCVNLTHLILWWCTWYCCMTIIFNVMLARKKCNFMFLWLTLVFLLYMSDVVVLEYTIMYYWFIIYIQIVIVHGFVGFEPTLVAVCDKTIFKIRHCVVVQSTVQLKCWSDRAGRIGNWWISSSHSQKKKIIINDHDDHSSVEVDYITRDSSLFRSN